MDPVMCRIRAPSGALNYLLEIHHFLWNHRSEKETDLVIISGKECVKVHEAVIFPMSHHPIDVLPPSCPCTKPALCLPPFPSHVLTAALEILYIGKASGVNSKEDLVKIKEVFSFLKVKGDIIADDLEGGNIGGEHDPGVAVNIELTDEENNNSIIGQDDRKQDNHNCYINDVKGFIDNDSLRNITERDKYVKKEPSSPYSHGPLAKLKPRKRKAKEVNDVGIELERKNISVEKAKPGNQKRDKRSSIEHSYSCNHCEYKSKFKFNLTKHIQQVHNNERRFMCDLCAKTYQTKSILRDHIECVHEKKEIMCDDCGRTFFSKINLRRHKRRSHTNEKPFMCDLCSKTYKYKISLQDHIELVHEKKEIMCDDCGRTFFSKISLGRHKRNVHVNVTNEFICDDCGKPFLTKTKLRRHQKNVHSDNPRKKSDNPGKNKRHNTCDECGKIFTTPEHLKHHKMVVHSGTENYNNDYVEDLQESFTDEVHLKDRKVSNSISCDECDRKFPCKSKLNYHVQIEHLGILPYACDQCDKKYKYNVSLKNHKLVHSGLATFNCDHCTEKFISKTTLARHLNESHNIQTYNQKYNQTSKRIRPKTQMCQLCSKWFRGISELKRHELVHTGERNHICHICNKAFSQKKQMKEHINQHLAGNLDGNGFQTYK